MDLSGIETTESINIELLTLDEVAAILKVDSTTVGRMIKSDELAAVHFGRTVRIRKAALLKFIDEHEGG